MRKLTIRVLDTSEALLFRERNYTPIDDNTGRWVVKAKAFDCGFNPKNCDSQNGICVFIGVDPQRVA